MGTEDDTFRILARPDIHAMVKLHIEWKRYSRRPYNARLNIDFVKYYGWGWREFLDERRLHGYFF